VNYHRNKYKFCLNSKSFDEIAMEKKIRTGEMSYPIIPFDPKDGIPSQLLVILEAIKLFIEKKTKTAEKRGINIKHYIKNELPELLDEDYDISDLNRLKNKLNERLLDFADKQERVKTKLDDILNQTSIIIGDEVFLGLLGNPPVYTAFAMEELVIKHIRQRNLEELAASEGLIEAIFIAIRQTKVFRQAEKTMNEYSFIIDLLDDYIRAKSFERTTLLHEHGQFESQREVEDIGDESTAAER